jgi:spore germination protein GerM
MRRLRGLFVLLLGAMCLSSCTLIPTAQNPATIPNSQVGFELLSKTIPDTNNGRVRFRTQRVYLVDASGHLAPSSRIVPSPPTLDSVLQELILGPTKIETYVGYTSRLPRDFVILQAVLKNKIGYLDISTPLSTLSSRRQLLAVGQLALTAQAVGATNGIEITVDGVVQYLLLPDGKRAHLVTAGDFKSLLNN